MEQTNCTALQSMEGFDDYIALLRSETEFALLRLEPCRKDVCVAIWGDGNPDISGIGVSIGYVVEVVLGATLVLSSMLLDRLKGHRWKLGVRVVQAGLQSFFDSALYFALAVEMAIVVMLVNKDFDISTGGFGAGDAQVALAISSLCILPLMQPLCRLRGPEEDENAVQGKGTRGRPRGETDAHRDNLVLLLYSFLVVLFFYPFVSQGMHNLGPVRMGEGKVVTIEEWEQVRNLCFRSITGLMRNELVLLKVSEMAASLVIYLFAAWQLLVAIARKMEADDRQLGDHRRATAMVGKARKFVQRYTRNGLAQAVFIVVPTTLAGILLYCVFRMRSAQKEMLEGLGARYGGDDWGFGQIMGIVIFAPVVTEMCFAAWKGSRREVVTAEVI